MNSTEEVKRITVTGILHEAWHSLTHVEKGLRRTIVALAIAPGKMLHQYLEGDRKQYQKPFSLLLISTALFALVLHLFHEHYVLNPTTFNERLFNNQLLLESKYYSWFYIALLPVFGLVPFLLFKRLKYNYAEWLVICCYLISFQSLLQIPFHVLLSQIHLNTMLQYGIQLIITSAYTLYALNAFLKLRMNRLRYLFILLSVVIDFCIFILALRGVAYLLTI